MLNSSSWNDSQSFHCLLFSDDSQIYIFSSGLCNELQTQFSTASSTVPPTCFAYMYYFFDQQNHCASVFLSFLTVARVILESFFSLVPYIWWIPMLCYVNPTLIVSLKFNSTSFTTHSHFSFQDCYRHSPPISLPPPLLSPVSYMICCESFHPKNNAIMLLPCLKISIVFSLAAA